MPLHSLLSSWWSMPEIQAVLRADTHVVALYQLQLPVEKVSKAWDYATQIANGQSIGTQRPEELKRLSPYLAKVLWIGEAWVGDADAASSQGMVTLPMVLSFPKDLLSSDLGMLQTVCFGKVSMLPNLRWLDVALPPSVAQAWQGSAYGQAGIRQRLGVPERSPLLMSIFKPCVGVPAHALADLLFEQAKAGIQLVKDDEVLADKDLSTALDRVHACVAALDRAEAECGHRPLYAVHLNAPVHDLVNRAERLLDAGAEAFLFNYLAYGLPVLHSLRQCLKGRAFLIVHPALGGALYQHPHTGMSPTLVFGTLPRLAGADAVLFPSPYGSVSLPKADALAVHHALHSAHLGVLPSFSVPSAGIQAPMVPQILKDFGTDVIINAGTGIHDVAGGSAAGIQAFQDALHHACVG